MLRSLVPALISIAAVGAQDWVWVEAESGSDKREQRNDWYEPVDRATSLSGGDWWRSFDEIGTESGRVTVPVAVPAEGRWIPWVRLNLSATGYRFAIDDAPLADLPLAAWQDEEDKQRRNPDFDRRIRDRMMASHDGSNRHQLAWVRLDPVQLAAGDHRLRFAVAPGKDGKGFAAVDCVVLAKDGFAFVPRLAAKPGERIATVAELDPAKTWSWPAAEDAFAASPIDLRRLNERVAGETGFIRRSDDGASFVRGDGAPIRFWSGTEYAWRIPFKDGVGPIDAQDAAEVAHKMRWLAKRGVNMVRFHGHLPPSARKNGRLTPDSIDEVDLHGAWYLVAAAKREGIYATISPYWGSHTDNERDWQLGFDGGRLSGLVFFYEPVQRLYRGWLRQLYTKVNPYTGIALKDDPAVGIIQLQNEDSLLFYTLQEVKGEPLAELTRQFARFAARKHGSLEAAFARYTLNYDSGWDLRGKDDLAAGTLAVLQNWFLTADARDRAKKWEDAGTRARLDDQLEFYATLMRDFNAATARYLREELGCRQLINAGNWKTVDPTTTEDAERWSYLANEVVGKNAYYSSIHTGINEGWQILPQHVYTSWSALTRPRHWPMNVKQPVGSPFIISESLWVPPNLYQSEGPLLVAAQLSLTGVDSFYWFASGERDWDPVLSKWPFASPMQAGQFPATALAFRSGYIAAASDPVVHEERSTRDIFTQRRPIIAESEVYDPNRDAGGMKADGPVTTEIDPLAFAVGRVDVRLGDGADAARNRVDPRLAGELIQDGGKRLVSSTGQIRTDAEAGIYTVDAPRCQAAAGFLAKRPRIDLTDVSIAAGNAYATIVVVPLDGLPIKDSRQVLIQAGTVARPSGWVVRPRQIDHGGKPVDGFQIIATGGAPWRIERTDATVMLANPHLRRVQALDINGMPQGAAADAAREGGRAVVRLPENALYAIVTAE